jgi:PIN domain nuclease of toxin-antitoxin system
VRLLLDSHIILWWATGDKKLGARASELIVDCDLFMSAANWWELALKRTLGRLNVDLMQTRRALEERNVSILSVTVEHAEAAAALPALHGDPFDHMLVAQASMSGLRLLTRDKQLKAYGTAVLCV